MLLTGGLLLAGEPPVNLSQSDYHRLVLLESRIKHNLNLYFDDPEAVELHRTLVRTGELLAIYEAERDGREIPILPQPDGKYSAKKYMLLEDRKPDRRITKYYFSAD